MIYRQMCLPNVVTDHLLLNINILLLVSDEIIFNDRKETPAVILDYHIHVMVTISNERKKISKL